MLTFLGQEAVDRLDTMEEKLDKLDPGKYSMAFLSGQVSAAFKALDEKLNENGYIIPGLGDAGDKIFGTR